MLALRYLFGISGQSLVVGALSPSATRTAPDEIAAYLSACETTMLDVDGDGGALPLTDAILIVRRLFGLDGPALIQGAIGEDCTRCTAEAVVEHIDSYRP